MSEHLRRCDHRGGCEYLFDGSSKIQMQFQQTETRSAFQPVFSFRLSTALWICVCLSVCTLLPSALFAQQNIGEDEDYVFAEYPEAYVRVMPTEIHVLHLIPDWNERAAEPGFNAEEALTERIDELTGFLELQNQLRERMIEQALDQSPDLDAAGFREQIVKHSGTAEQNRMVDRIRAVVAGIDENMELADLYRKLESADINIDEMKELEVELRERFSRTIERLERQAAEASTELARTRYEKLIEAQQERFEYTVVKQMKREISRQTRRKDSRGNQFFQDNALKIDRMIPLQGDTRPGRRRMTTVLGNINVLSQCIQVLRSHRDAIASDPDPDGATEVVEIDPIEKLFLSKYLIHAFVTANSPALEMKTAEFNRRFKSDFEVVPDSQIPFHYHITARFPEKFTGHFLIHQWSMILEEAIETAAFANSKGVRSKLVRAIRSKLEREEERLESYRQAAIERGGIVDEPTMKKFEDRIEKLDNQLGKIVLESQLPEINEDWIVKLLSIRAADYSDENVPDYVPELKWNR